METRTIAALAELTDEGLFERIATAVLRLDPDYEGIAHTGINPDGKTRKSPVDGLRFTGEGGSRLIVVHHTITAAESLGTKWMLDPSKVTRRKDSKSPPAAAGDVVKSFEIIHEERVDTPDLAATLILATNQEPGEKLIRMVVAAGRAENVTIDVWTRSRIAARLDTDPRGQVIRRKLLGIEEELLSRELVVELSRQSVAAFHAGDDARLRVARRLDARLESRLRPITFIVGGSGAGKTVAAHKALGARVLAGGAAIVVTDAGIEAALSLEQAVMATLRQLQPTLAAGQNPFSIFSEEDPLLILIEDVNQAAQPSRLVEKLAGWSPKDGNGGLPAWRILCPVWPHVLRGVRSQLVDQIASMSVRPEPMSHEEATSAVAAHARSTGIVLPADKADSIATELGDDPLLIALNRHWSAPRADQVIERFVEDALNRVAQQFGQVAAELRAALLDFGGTLLRQRKFEPRWSDILGWGISAATLERVRGITQGADIIWMDGPSTNTMLRFRHDRVRDWVLAEAALAFHSKDELDDALLAEPALAEVIGTVLVIADAPDELIARVRSNGPLALFHALRLAPREGPATARLAEAACTWLRSSESRGSARATLRWQAMAALEGVLGEYVRGLIHMFPEQFSTGLISMLRNGDVQGGVALSSRFDFSTVVAWTTGPLQAMSPWRRADMAAKLGKLIDAEDDNIEGRRSALISFAGVLADPDLAPALERSWNSDTRSAAHLEVYLWAMARCATSDTAARLLGPICALWAALPLTSDDEMLSLRDDLAAHSVRFGFERAIPSGAMGYFTERAKKPDLAWQIEYMLHGIDHPDALLLQVERGSERLLAGDSYIFANQAREHWRRTNEGYGTPMSSSTRDMLRGIWQDEDAEPERRKAAFDLWEAGRESGDVAFLREAGNDLVLADGVLRGRLGRGDAVAIPELIQRLDGERGRHWWFYARYVWSAAMYDALRRALQRAADEPLKEGDTQYEIGSTYTRVIMRLSVPHAERLLLQYWESFGRTLHFVQAALYVGTPELLVRANAAISESAEPAALFRHFTMHFGIRVADEVGIAREQQIQALAPYFKYLCPQDLGTLADVCNENGWYDLRRQLIDPHLSYAHVETPDRFRRKLDDALAQGQPSFIDLDVDRILKADVSWRELAETIRGWLVGQTSVTALELAERAIRHAGQRGDAAILTAWTGEDAELREALIVDLDFALRRREGRRH